MKRSNWLAFITTILMIVLVAYAPAQADDRLEKALDTTLTLEIENTTLRDVCLFLGEKYGVNILIDDGVVAPAGRKVSKPYVTDGLVQYVNMKDVTAREALHAILHPLGLTYTVKERYVWITTEERINTKPYSDIEVQIFEVPAGKATETNDGAFGEPNVITLLRKVVPAVLDPDTGELLSYMRYNLLTNQLAVKNTSDNLDTIQQLLELITDASQPKQQ